MSSKYERYQRRRLISSYFSVVLSIFLMLFLLGLLGLFVINSRKLTNDFKEEIAMTVFFKSEIADSSKAQFQAKLATAPYIKSFKYVSREEAAEDHKKAIGEDFVAFLGINPLQDSYDIHLKANYVVNDSIDKITAQLSQSEDVSEVVYDKQLVTMVNENVERVSFWILIVSGVLALIAVLLINSSLRLSIYSNRFIIKTMQMVGATKSFIRSPFIKRSITLGIIGAVLAIMGLVAVLFYLDSNYPKLGLWSQPELTGLVLAAVLVLGVLITYLSTFFATQRFLNLRTDDLY